MRRVAVLAVLALCADCTSNAKPLGSDPFVAAFRELRPSVVLLTMQIPSDDPKRKGDWDDAYGTGVVVASGAWGSQVLTVEHVVHGARRLHATFREQKDAPVRLIASDEQDDLALLEASVPQIPVARLGTSRGLEAGDAIGVAGFPIPDAFADEGLAVKTSVYAGRISSVRNDALELDLPIIPGESGGPVFEANSGDVIGLAESRFEEERAIGFAIPIDDALRFLKGKEHASPAPRTNVSS